MSVIAIVREATGRVVTLVRSDVPTGFKAPDGCKLVPGNSLPADYEVEPQELPVPSPISAAQLRLWLLQHELLDGVAVAIAALPAEQKAAYEIMWEYETTFTRDNPQMLAIADALGLSSADVDTAFREASLL